MIPTTSNLPAWVPAALAALLTYMLNEILKSIKHLLGKMNSHRKLTTPRVAGNHPLNSYHSCSTYKAYKRSRDRQGTVMDRKRGKEWCRRITYITCEIRCISTRLKILMMRKKKI